MVAIVVFLLTEINLGRPRDFAFVRYGNEMNHCKRFNNLMGELRETSLLSRLLNMALKMGKQFEV